MCRSATSQMSFLCLALAGLSTVCATAAQSNYVSWCVYADSTCNPSAEIECTMVPLDGSCDVHHFDTHSFALHYTNTTDVGVQFFFQENCAGGHTNFTVATDSCVPYFDHADPPNYVYLSHINEAVAESIQQSQQALTTSLASDSDVDTAMAVAVAALVLSVAFILFGSVAMFYVVRTSRRQQRANGVHIKSSITSPSDTQVTNMRNLE